MCALLEEASLLFLFIRAVPVMVSHHYFLPKILVKNKKKWEREFRKHQHHLFLKKLLHIKFYTCLFINGWIDFNVISFNYKIKLYLDILI